MSDFKDLENAISNHDHKSSNPGSTLTIDDSHSDEFYSMLLPGVQAIFNNPVMSTVVEIEEGHKLALQCLYFGRMVVGEVTTESLQIFANEVNRAYELGLIEHGALGKLFKLQLCHTWIKSDGTLLYPDYGPDFKEAIKNDLDTYPKGPDRFIICFYPLSRYTLEQAKIIFSPFNPEGVLPSVIKKS